MCLTVVSQNKLPNSRLPDYLRLANGKCRNIRCTSRYLSTHSTCSSTSTQRSIKMHRNEMDAAKQAVIYLRLQSADSRQPTVTDRRKHQHYSHTTPRHHKRVCGGKVGRIPGQKRSVVEQRNALSNSQSPQQEMEGSAAVIGRCSVGASLIGGPRHRLTFDGGR